MYRVRYFVVPFWLILTLALGGLFAVHVTDVLKGGGFYTPGSGSDNADAALGKYFHAASSGQALVALHSDSSKVDDFSFKDEATAAENRLKKVKNVHSVTSYYDTGDLGSVSPDKHTTYLTLSIDGDSNTVANTVPKLRDQLTDMKLQHWVTGGAAFSHDGAEAAQQDVEKSEKLTLPVVVLLLVIVFATIVSAVIPLFLGIFTVVITVALVSAIGQHLDTSIFALNIGSMLGLGLAVDYSLIVVTRFREEFALWKDTRRALGVTLATAGRSITYSGITVILAMLALTIVLWPMLLIRSISLAVLICALVGILLAMTLLPSVLSILAQRTEWLRVIPAPKKRKIGQTGIWYRFSELVMKQPVAWLVGALLILLALGSPVLQLTTAGPSAPKTTEATKGLDELKNAFSGNKLSPIQIVIQAPKDGVWKPDFLAATRAMSNKLLTDSRVSDVNSLSSAMWFLNDDQFKALTPSTLGKNEPIAAVYVNRKGDNNVMFINVISKYDSRDSRSEALLKDIRDKFVPEQKAFKSDTVNVGGETATFYDYKVSLLQRFPYALAVVMVMIFVMLMMFFQSLFLPFKAVVLNLISLGATFGVLVLVFQHGYGDSLLNFSALGYITVITPVILYVILFALSTDYEVFMLSRVKEHYFKFGDNREAVAVGLQNTAGLITAAALILLGTFGSFSFGDSIVVKELGVGLGIGVLLDSTLVRTVMVPASMALAGKVNWYMPGWLKRVLPELSEGTSNAIADQTDAAPAPTTMSSIPAAVSGRPVATGPALLRLRSKTLDVVPQVKLVPGRPCRFGRDDGNEIQIVVPTVSRHHARIDTREGVWTLRDLGSANGTWVNGRRVQPGDAGVQLHNGDWIMLGGLDDLLMIFETTSPQGPAPQQQQPAAATR